MGELQFNRVGLEFLWAELNEGRPVRVLTLGMQDNPNPLGVEFFSETSGRSSRVEWDAFYYAGLAVMETDILKKPEEDPRRKQWDMFVEQLKNSQEALIKPEGQI